MNVTAALQPGNLCGQSAFDFKGSDAGRAERHSPWRQQYLLITKGLRALDLALAVVLHDHHSCVDFPHCQVCGC